MSDTAELLVRGSIFPDYRSEQQLMVVDEPALTSLVKQQFGKARHPSITKAIFKIKKVVRTTKRKDLRLKKKIIQKVIPVKKEKAPPQIKIDMVKKFVFRCFQNRLKIKRQETQGVNYYYRD